MKPNLFKLYLLSFFILSDFMLFAQGPGDDDDGGGLEDDDPPATPINGKLIWLALIGALYALHVYRSYKKKANA